MNAGARRSRRGLWLWLWLWLAFVLAGVAGLRSMTQMPGSSQVGPLPPSSGEEAELRERLQGHVAVLAGAIGERNLWRYEALQAAADYIEQSLRTMGYRVSSQDYVVEGKTVRNIEAERTGAVLPGEIVLLGAHYDSVAGSPGANDNASGVAALLELARRLSEDLPARSVRFVAFANEEPPFFYTGAMGSRVYARRAAARGEKIVAMLSLETIGYYSKAPGSQRYPFPFGFFYPDQGNFIAFVGNLASRELVRRCVRSFRSHTAFPAEGLAAPGWMGGVHWSDHWSFWREGYPALMVTDTALYRYAHYHARTDTPDQIDYERLARVVAGLHRASLDLAATKREGAP